METVAVVNRKGGVGKTATAHALGAGLAKAGKHVLFVDLDSQSNLSFALGADLAGPSSLDVLTGKAQAAQAIQHTAQGDIIPASAFLDTITGKGGYSQLLHALEAVRGSYDFTIIDTPAQLNYLTLNALSAADSTIIPVQADIYSLQGVGLLSDVIEDINQTREKPVQIRGFLITRHNRRAVISRDMRDNLQEIAAQLKTQVYKTEIRECISIKEAAAVQQDIFSYAPKSNAAVDYLGFVNEFLSQ